MFKRGRLIGALALVLSLVMLVAGLAEAQGVTSAAVRGAITRAGGEPVGSAVVSLLNTQKGTVIRAQTQASGRYFFDNVEPGGPYTIEVRAIGFESLTKTGIMLSLGQRYDATFELSAQVVTLEELTVTAVTNPLINSSRTGAEQTISDAAIMRMPMRGRNFVSLIQTNPQVTITAGGGTSIGGQNNRFNAIQIDGGVNNDVFGLAASGTPGGQAGAKPISLEALKEFQILIAPFDVRQGGFTGGLVNGVTKSGTNKFSGSIFGYFQNRDLVGVDTGGNKIEEFKIRQYGGTVGGPVIKNRVHFFAAFDAQGSESPFFGASATEPQTGITVATADRVRNSMISRFNIDPGTWEGPIIERPDLNFFAKISAQLSDKQVIEISNNYVDAGDDNLGRGTRNLNNRDGYQLSASGYRFDSKTNSTRLKWFGQFGGLSTEVIAGYQTVRDKRNVGTATPLLMVQGDVAGNYLAAGGERFSQANQLDQDVAELTANVSFLKGDHLFTIGTHNEFFSFMNIFFPASKGVWTFNNVTDFENAVPNRYEIALPTAARPDGPVAEFGVRQLGFYLQDQFNPSDRLTITAGVRIDVPFSDTPVTNDDLKATSALGNIDTGDFPTGNMLFSPRLGFNWDATGSGTTIIRGGVGVFSGRPPYVWMANAFSNTGREQVTLLCTGSGIPTFTVDYNNQPTSCAAGAPPSPPIASVNYFDPSFKFQQALKYALGLDHQLPGGVVAAVDFSYTRSQNQLYLVDENLVAGSVNGEGRLMYGTISSTGSATKTRQSTAFGQVIRHENRSADKSASIVAQLNKRFSDNLAFNASYAWAKTEDLMSLGSSIASSNLQFTVLNGTLEERELRTSGFDIPSKISISGTANVPFGFAVSLAYNGLSGRPYSYVTTNDANADGISSNDALYIPANASDISLTNPADWDRLNLWLVGEECLNNKRGTVQERNSCRNQWRNFLDLRVSKMFTTFSGQGMEITADVFNLLNLVNDDWGLIRETNNFEQKSGVLSVAGWDTRGTAAVADDRPRYSVASVLPTRDRVSVSASRWRIQLGVRYTW